MSERTIQDIREYMARPAECGRLPTVTREHVHALLSEVDRLTRARDDRFFVSGQMLAIIEATERNPAGFGEDMRCLAAGLRRAMEKDARVSREEAYALVEAELRELSMEVGNDSRVLWAGYDTLLKAIEKYKEHQ